MGEKIPVHESEGNVRLAACNVIDECAQKLIDEIYSEFNGGKFTCTYGMESKTSSVHSIGYVISFKLFEMEVTI